MGMIDMDLDLVAYEDTEEADEAMDNAAMLTLKAILTVGMFYALAWALERFFG